ncbi:hypothetical protein KKF34_00885 [Myxococcota bacterium]|nr:hypothetical protein [Myxococcota bacterium]MBU1382199.1 hypothetical protein [Myxococcota bacterium]MBU1495416.1 hypothetical protein [Myxococcota bacterium]
MASKLSSLLVKRNLIPVRKLDQAFQRQVLFGGTLDTTLLEMGLFNEMEIMKTLVEASQFPTIDLRFLKIENPLELSTVFPPKLAQRYGVIPVVKQKDFIGVLVTGEIERNKIDEMGFMLGLSLHPRVVPEIRLWEYAKIVYGFPVEDRMLKLLEKLGPVPGYPEELTEDWTFDALHQEEAIDSSNYEEEINENFQIDASADSASPEHLAPESSTEGEMTPVPKFEYIEKRIPSDILVPSIVHRTKIETGEFEKAIQRESGEIIDDDYGFNDVVTKPGFDIPKKKSEEIKDFMLIDGGDSFDDIETKTGYEEVKTTVTEAQTSASDEEEKPWIADDSAGDKIEAAQEDAAENTQDKSAPSATELTESDSSEATDVETDDSPSNEEPSTESQIDQQPIGSDAVPESEISDIKTELIDGEPDFSAPETPVEQKQSANQVVTASYTEARQEEKPPLDDPLDMQSTGFPDIPDVPDYKAMADNIRARDISSFDGSSLSIEELTENLFEAEDKDRILTDFLRFSSNWFEFSYIFTINNDAAQGRFAIFNRQLDQHNVRNYLISLNFDSIMKESVQGRIYIGPLMRDDGSLFIIDYLSLGRPAFMASIPLSIGNRVVALLLGVTNKEHDFNSVSQNLITAATFTSKALVQLIKKTKISKKIGKVRAESPLHSIKMKAGPGLESLLGGAVNSQGDPAVTAPIKIRDQQGVEEVIALMDRLEQNFLRLGGRDQECVNLLKTKREQTLEVLSFYFPGMITYKQIENEEIPPPSKHGPLLDFVVDWGLNSVGLLMDLMDSDSPIVRYYSVFLFEEIRLPEAIFRIGEKLFDMDMNVRAVAARVLLSYEGHRELEEVILNISNYITSDEPFLQRCSIEAVGRLKARETIEPLLTILRDASSDLARLIAEALKMITLRDYKDNVNRWASWWALNKQRHRILWLIEALRQSEKSLKVIAITELYRITGEKFNFRPDADPEENEESIKTWITWWERRGRQIFSGE